MINNLFTSLSYEIIILLELDLKIWLTTGLKKLNKTQMLGDDSDPGFVSIQDLKSFFICEVLLWKSLDLVKYKKWKKVVLVQGKSVV